MASLIQPVLAFCGFLAAFAPATEQRFFGATERIRGFDPVTASDTSSIAAICKVYEGLYEFEYLVRPYEIRPLLAEALPEVSPDRLTYTIRVKPSVRFADDRCFPGGKGRELIAADFVYSWKRLADVHNRSTRYFNLEGRIVGLDEYRKKSLNQKVSYDEPVEGLQVLDRYTLQIKLKAPYPQLLYILCASEMFAVPREAVEYYGPEFLNHPVGTGPFILKEWKWRNYRIEFVRSPTYHGGMYPTRGAPGDKEAGLLDDAGKPLPFLDRVTQYVIADDSTAWLKFLAGDLATSAITRNNFDAVLDQQQGLTPEMKARGIRLEKAVQMFTVYVGFNMEDPVVGASPDAVVNERHKKLRQALSCAVDIEKWVQFYNNRHIPAVGPIPPNVAGYDPGKPREYGFDLERAKRLLAEAGYPGGRNAQTGKRLSLTIELPGGSDPNERQSVDLLASFLDAIGVELKPNFNNWPEFLKKLERRQAQMYRVGWIIDYPDAYNFLLLFYSPNASPGPNESNYTNPEYDRLFEQARVIDDSPERTALYLQMAEIIIEDCPWIFLSHPLAFGLFQPWLKNYKYHDRPYPNAKYYRVEPRLMTK